MGKGVKLENTVAYFLIACAFLLGAALRLSHLDIPKRSPDEWFYTFYAKTVMEKGTGSIKGLVKEYNSVKDLWIYPPPIRVGHIYLASAAMKIARSTDAKTVSYVSVASSIAALLLLILIGLRFFNPWVTLSALLLMGSSPMDLAVARRAWQDSLLAAFGIAMVYFACEITKNPKRRIWYPFFFLCGICTILIKESGIIIYSLCVAWLEWMACFRRRSFTDTAIIGILGLLSAAAAFFILANAAGGASNIIATVKNNLGSPGTNRYAVLYQSGPWYSYIQCLFIISPITMVLSGIGIVGLALALRSLAFYASVGYRKEAVLGILFFALAFLAIAMVPRHMINLRYITVVYVPFYLMAGVGFWHIVCLVKKIFAGFPLYAAIIAIMALLVAAAVSDYRNFKKVFVEKRVSDLSVRLLKRELR
jgi:hypothetical protein